MAPARQGLQKRVADAILEGAAQAFVAGGAEASMGDVAAAAGVARATVYRYFPNREALLEELAAMAIREAGERLVAARLDELPPEEAVSRAVRALVEVGDAFIVIARQGMRSKQFEQTVRLPLVRLLERARGDGDIRTDVPVTWLTEALLGMAVSVMLTSERRAREDAIAAIVKLFLDGARRRGPRPA